VEIGYWLGRPFWGRGYMTEAVDAALLWAGDGWGRRYLLAGHFADNPASGQVLVKAGFLYTGDVVPRFSMARGEEAPTRMMVWLA
jgi:RimJ/RimL family protein N-acetyltransferase